MSADRFAIYRDRDPVHWHAPSGAWLITRHEDVARLLADPRLTSRTLGDRIEELPGLGSAERAELAAFYRGWLSLIDGPAHHELRRAIAPILAPGRVAPWAPALHRIAAEQARSARWERIEETFARPYTSRALGAVLGLEPAEFVRVLAATGRFLRLIGPGAPPVRDVRAAHAGLAVIGRTAAALTGRSPSAGGPEPLFHGSALPDELRGPALVQFVAGGFDPLVRLLTTYAAAGPPESGDVVDEVLRRHPPFEVLPRIASDPVPVRDRVLPRGSRVLLAIGSAGRDRGAGAAPGAGWPALVSFGGGPHRCPAAHLGRAALAAGITALDTLRPVARSA